MIAQLPRRSGCLALGIILIGSMAWARSGGTAEEESAIRALMQSIFDDHTNATKAKQYADDADWTNAFGRRLQGREAISQWFDGLAQSADYNAGAVPPASRKLDVRFVRPDVAGGLRIHRTCRADRSDDQQADADAQDSCPIRPLQGRRQVAHSVRVNHGRRTLRKTEIAANR
jgi:uncharacterized protein (TIGR02246 family)